MKNVNQEMSSKEDFDHKPEGGQEVWNAETKSHAP